MKRYLLVIITLISMIACLYACTQEDAQDFYVSNTNLALEDTARLAVIKAEAAVIAAQTAAAKVELFNSAIVYLFPSSTAYNMVLRAGATNNYSGWEELVDSGGFNLSSSFATKAGYISDIYIYGIDPETQSNSGWILELSYGNTHIDLGRIMFFADINASTVGGIAQIKSRRIPAGEKVYYRLESSSFEGSAILASFRYFYE
jgi:hypothetical protein